MVLYDEFGNRREYNLNNKFDKGTTSKIYKISEDECIKLHDSYFIKNFILYKDIFKIINDLKSDNMCKINELLYNNYNEYHRKINAYTMKCYINQINNILEYNTEYLLDNLNDLYNIVIKLSEHKIYMSDMAFYKNAILDNNKIILIDFDDYEIQCDKIVDEIKQINIKNLKILFLNIFINHSEINYKHYNESLIHYLFINNDNDNLVKCVSNKIKQYKYPIDFFRFYQ